MGTKYYQKQPIFSKVCCWLCMYVFRDYILFRCLEKVLYGWANSEPYLEPSETSKMELFMKIVND